jgi:hypothetical protein
MSPTPVDAEQSPKFVSLKQAADFLPGRPHISTIWRWAFKGIRGIKLKTVVAGGRRYTDLESLQSFVAATTAAANGESPPRAPKKDTKKETKEVLRRAGIEPYVVDTVAKR